MKQYSLRKTVHTSWKAGETLTRPKIETWLLKAKDEHDTSLVQGLLGLCIASNFKEGIELCLKEGADLNKLVPERFFNQWFPEIKLKSYLNHLPAISRHPMSVALWAGHWDVIPELFEKGMKGHYRFGSKHVWDALIYSPSKPPKTSPEFMNHLFQQAAKEGWMIDHDTLISDWESCWIEHMQADIYQGLRPEIWQALFQNDLFSNADVKQWFAKQKISVLNIYFRNTSNTNLTINENNLELFKESIRVLYRFVPEVFGDLTLSTGVLEVVSCMEKIQFDNNLPSIEKVARNNSRL